MDTLLVLIGSSPQWREEVSTAGRLWDDVLGKLMLKFVEAFGLDERCVTLMTKCLRCKTPMGQSVKISQAKRCKVFNDRDVKSVLAKFKGIKRIVLFALGGPSAAVYGGMSLTKGYGMQGIKVEPIEGRETVVFFSNNPVLMQPGYKPHIIDAVRLHWQLVADYVNGVDITKNDNIVWVTADNNPTLDWS